MTDARASRREDIRRAIENMVHPVGLALVMFSEDQYLMSDAVRAYIGGSDAGTIFCSHAVCERELAGVVAHSGTAPSGSDRWGLGKLVAHLTQRESLPIDLLNRLTQLNEHRKTLYHYGHANSLAALEHRTVNLIDQVGSDKLREGFEEKYGYAGSNKEVHRFAMDTVLRRSALAAIAVTLELRSYLSAEL